MSTVTFTFVESNDAPLRVRGCAIVGQANRFGGVVQGNCALSFGNWRQGRELITNVLSTLDPAKSEIAVDAPEGAQGQ
jgi:hypothetical protein